MTIDTPTAGDFKRMKRGRVAINRFLLFWPTVQAAAGPCTAQTGSACNWAPIDQIVDGAARHGIPLLPFLYGTPGWASHRHGPLAGRTDPLLTPDGRAGWKRFVSAAVSRYGPGGAFWAEHPALKPDPIKKWQVWNEQNGASLQPNPSVKAYAALLKVTSKRIRAAEPKADVILGGMFGTPDPSQSHAPTSWHFLDGLYKIPGIKSSFDAVALHPYSPGLHGVKYQLDKIRHVIEKHNDGRAKLWVTELGWGSDAKNVHQNPLVKSPQGQKKLLVRSFRMLNAHRREWNIAGVNWFSWRDPTNPASVCQFCQSSGMFTRHLSPKPAWKAFTTFSGGHP